MNYATDGICHNAQPGTFGHECGKPAKWVGTKENGFQCGFCNDCKETGHEARQYGNWTAFERVKNTPGPWTAHAQASANFYTLRKDNNWIASIQFNGEQMVSKQEANINLLSAAPDMLEALRSIAAESTIDGPDLIATIQGICRFAITKATGEPS